MAFFTDPQPYPSQRSLREISGGHQRPLVERMVTSGYKTELTVPMLEKAWVDLDVWIWEDVARETNLFRILVLP